MTDQTRALLAEGEALDREIAEIFAAIDAELEAWGRAIEAGRALAREVRDACAELEEWLC
jgi:hypothetical protein